MSFISEEEGLGRLKDPSNILSRADRSSREDLEPVDLDSILIPFAPDDKLDLPDLKVPEKKASSHKSPDLNFDPFAALKIAKQIDEGLDQKGRKANIRNRTTEENAAVGLTSLILGSTHSEEMFGVGVPQQSLIRRGMTGSLDPKQGRAPKQDLLDSIYEHGKTASEKAFKKLFSTLDSLTDDKIKSVSKATDLAKIATSMARVVQSVTPKDSGDDHGGVHFHIWKPEQNQVDDYDTVEVRPDGSVIIDGEIREQQSGPGGA